MARDYDSHPDLYYRRKDLRWKETGEKLEAGSQSYTSSSRACKSPCKGNHQPQCYTVGLCTHTSLVPCTAPASAGALENFPSENRHRQAFRPGCQSTPVIAV